MPARRHGHDFYSMTSEMAGKCAFPLRRKPRRSKILVPFQGTSEWLGGAGPGSEVARLGGLGSRHQQNEGNKECEGEQPRSPHEQASESVEDSEHENCKGDQPVVEDSHLND